MNIEQRYIGQRYLGSVGNVPYTIVEFIGTNEEVLCVKKIQKTENYWRIGQKSFIDLKNTQWKLLPNQDKPAEASDDPLTAPRACLH